MKEPINQKRDIIAEEPKVIERASTKEKPNKTERKEEINEYFEHASKCNPHN